MVQKTQKTTKKSNVTKAIKTTTKPSKVVAITSMTQTNHDLLVSLLIVSVVVNMFFLTAWVTLQVTNAYDTEVASFLFAR